MYEFKTVGCRKCIEEKGLSEVGKLPRENAKVHGHLYLCQTHYDEVLGR